MSTKQPDWKFIANLGDTHPITYGGYFIFIDETGVYPPKAELLQEPSDDEVNRDDRAKDQAERDLAREFEAVNPDADCAACDSYVAEHLPKRWTSRLKWTVYRFTLEPCTYINGILSDNKHHPDKPAWFTKPESERKDRPQDTTYLKDVALSSGQPGVGAFISSLTGDDVVDKAWAWRAIGEYHGFENLDHYPLSLNRAEVEARYKDLIAVKFKPKE